MATYADRIKETSTTTGTGTITLSGTSVIGYRTFSQSVTDAGEFNLTDGGATVICIEMVNASGVPTGEWEVCESIYTVAGNTVTRGTLLSSSTASRVNFSAGTKNVFVVAPAKSIINYNNVFSEVCNFRISGVSGTSVPTTGTYAITTLYAVPIDGNKIGLYNGSSWDIVTSAEFSLALGTLTNNVPYDVFCYNNAGVATLEYLAWTNDTTRATGLVLQDGILVKSGATTRRYLATFYNGGNTAATVTMTIASPCVVTWTGHTLPQNAPIVFTTTGALPTGLTASTTYYLAATATVGGMITANTFNISATPGGALINTSGTQSGTHTGTVSTYTEDSPENRLLWNYYNRFTREMFVTYPGSGTYTTAVFRQAAANKGNQLNFVIGIDDTVVSIQANTYRSNSTAGVNTVAGIGLDSTSTRVNTTTANHYLALAANNVAHGACWWIGHSGIGRHYASWLEYSTATGTTTWVWGSGGIGGVILG